MLCREIKTRITMQLSFIVDQSKETFESMLKLRACSEVTPTSEIKLVSYRMVSADTHAQTIVFEVQAIHNLGLDGSSEDEAKESILQLYEKVPAQPRR